MRYALRILFVVALALLFVTPAAVRAGDSNDPIIWATPTEGEVAGIYWPDGADVTLSVNDPSNGPSVDYQDTMTSEPADFDPQVTVVIFNLDAVMNVVPGLELTMSDGVTDKMHTVTNVTATSVDTAADTVTGTADPGSDVRIEVWGAPLETLVAEDEVADGAGNWTADFSGSYDIDDMTAGPALQTDNDGDVTAYYWFGGGGDGGEEQPHIQAIPSDDRIEGYAWPLGAEVTLTIENGGGSAADYTDSAIVAEAPFDPQQTYVEFQLQGTFDVVEGQTVTMTDNTTTKTLIITLPTVTGIDPAADTISGTATPGADVNVDVHVPPMQGANRHEVADASGNWTADFSTPGDEGGEDQTIDIAFGQNLEVGVNQADDDGDVTQIHMLVAPADGDVNCDGKVDAIDALTILRHIAGLTVNLPPGCPPIGSY